MELNHRRSRDSAATRLLVAAGLGAAFLLTLWAAPSGHVADDNYTVIGPQQTITKTFPLAGAEVPSLDLNNVVGEIHVVGDAHNEIRMTAIEQVRAETRSDLDEAAKEVHLDTSQDGNFVKVYADGPFRCGGGCEWGGEMHWHAPDYTARFDFELHVPANTSLILRTVTGGSAAGEASAPDILVENTTGDFQLNDVNGGVTLTAVSGSGQVRTVNGPITAAFRENPRADVGFNTVNGAIHLYFQPGLSADVHFKTLNGNVFSDFDTTPQATAATATAESDGLRLYRSGRNAVNSVRIGAGGPAISLTTVNGNIFIHKHS